MPLSLTFDHRAAPAAKPRASSRRCSTIWHAELTAHHLHDGADRTWPTAAASPVSSSTARPTTSRRPRTSGAGARPADGRALREDGAANTPRSATRPGDLHIEVQKVDASLARAPGHRSRRHRRRSRTPGSAGREARRLREALVGDGSADRAALLRGEDAQSREGRRTARTSGDARPLSAACRPRRRDCARPSSPDTGPGPRARTPLRAVARRVPRRRCRSTR